MDDRYTEGVWYEASTGDFVRLDRDDDADEAIICDEEGDELDRIDLVNFEPSDYYRIPEEVVEDPVSFLEGRLDRLVSGYYGRSGEHHTTFREEKTIKYARQQVTLSEADDE